MHVNTGPRFVFVLSTNYVLSTINIVDITVSFNCSYYY